MVDGPRTRARIRVRLDEPIGEVHPHLYGHFIEHLGECIYNGMWAELLQNRKLAGHDALHYGVVHGWVPVGAGTLRVYPGARVPSGRGDDEGFHADDPVAFMHDNTLYCCPGDFGRGQSQRIDVRRADGEPKGIGQEGIGLVGGRRYTGRVVLRADGLRPGETGPTRAEVWLDGEVREIAGLDGEWRSFDLAFTAHRSAATARFAFTAHRSAATARFAVTTRQAGRLWVGCTSLMPADAERGWRRDVNDLIRALKPPIVRYPGGNFASQYHWRDGIGPRDRRPVRNDRAWLVYEPNDVGTDEFVEWCRLIGTEPYLCVNTGDGTPEEAAAWVEYCNGPADSQHGALRAANGHPEPHNVVYWGIGNETYGNWQVGHVDAETYARECVAFARAMRAASTSGARNGRGKPLKLLAVGATPDRWPDWNAAVARIAGAEIDYVTLHHYARADEHTPPEDEYLMTVTAPARIADLIAASRRDIDANAPGGKRIPISFDEWNVTHRAHVSSRPPRRIPDAHALAFQARAGARGGVERQNYALADGLYAAGFFNVVLRNADHVTMANQAQLVNLLGLIETNDVDAYGTPEYLAFKLYVDHSGPVALRATSEGPTFDVPAMGNMPARPGEPTLDVAATADRERRRVWVHVVNRDPERPAPASIDLGDRKVGRVIARTLVGPHAWARNSFGAKENVRIESRPVELSAEGTYTFPACSATALEIELTL